MILSFYGLKQKISFNILIPSQLNKLVVVKVFFKIVDGSFEEIEVEKVEIVLLEVLVLLVEVVVVVVVVVAVQLV